jgi:hypothetical protein
MLQLVPRHSLSALVLASTLAMISLPGLPAAQTGKAQTGKAQTAAVEKQGGQAASKAGGQSIVALVNDEPVTAYEIEQRARFLSLSSNIGDKVKENFKRLAEQESTNQQLRAIMQQVIDSRHEAARRCGRCTYEAHRRYRRGRQHHHHLYNRQLCGGFTWPDGGMTPRLRGRLPRPMHHPLARQDQARHG